MIVDTVFFYLLVALGVIEGISALSLVAAIITYIIYPPSKSPQSRKKAYHGKPFQPHRYH